MADLATSRTLPRDVIRTLLAVAIALLTVGGWIFSLMRPELRSALGSQTALWWIEQLVSLALMVACIGVIMEKRAFVSPAFWLSAYSLVFDLMRWFFEFDQGSIPIPVTVVLYALFMWRLRLTRRAIAIREAPSTP